MLLPVLFIIYFINKRRANNSARNGVVYEATNSMFPNLKKYTVSAVAAIIAVIFLLSSITIIDAGTVGVYSLFGKVRDEVLQPGIHLINPFANIIPMSVRTLEYTMSKSTNEGKVTGDDSITALTKEGLEISLDITVLYHIDQSKAAGIYKTLGLEYEEKVVRPEIRSGIREITARYDAKGLYSEKRQEANDQIAALLKKNLGPRSIIIEQILLRDVSLPQNLAQSISEKLQAEQEAQKYDFVLDKEKKEAERKRIEAAGQRDAQKIINESLSTNYLYYQYISQLKDRQGTVYVPTNPSTGMPQFKELGK